MKVGTIIGRVGLGVLALSVIPYQFKKDKETGAFEVRSLLWGWKKTPGSEEEGKDHIVFAIPASGLDSEEEKKADTPMEEIGSEIPREV